MAIFDEGDGNDFADMVDRFAWVPNVLAVEYGEWETDETVPATLNWLDLVPEDPRYDFDEVECALVYVSDATGYTASIWDATGEDDLPWAVFIADAFGVRLLPEYSILDEDADEEDLEAVLAKAATELPVRLESGEFDRTGEPVIVPEWLLAVPDDEDAGDAE